MSVRWGVRRQPGLSVETVRDALVAIRHAFGWALDRVVSVVELPLTLTGVNSPTSKTENTCRIEAENIRESRTLTGVASPTGFEPVFWP